jgi:GNAT superfamily N-acetyltransferase
MDYSTATVDDSLDVTHIWRRFQRESSQSYVDFDWDKAHEQVLSWIEDKDWEIFLAWKGRILCGVLIGAVTTYPYSRALIAGDYIWYIIPESRGGMTGVRLMRMMETWARDRGAVSMETGSTSGVENRAMGLMERLGFSPVGMLMRKGL